MKVTTKYSIGGCTQTTYACSVADIPPSQYIKKERLEKSITVDVFDYALLHSASINTIASINN